jgi:PAS domain S-box-containing protein
MKNEEIKFSSDQESPVGYAYHKILCDRQGVPCDYVFLDVNPTFERLTGYKALDIIGKTASRIFGGLKSSDFDRIRIFGDIAMNGGNQDYIQYMEVPGEWYRVKVFSIQKGYFTTLFSDISRDANFMGALSQQAKPFLQLPFGELNYQAISNDIMKISNASYVFFYIYDDSNKCFVNKAISGISQDKHKVSEILGFGPPHKKGEIDVKKIGELSGGKLVSFPDLHKLAPMGVPDKTLIELEKMFNIGETHMIEITNTNKTIGLVILIMEKGVALLYRDVVELYAHQVGHAILREKVETELKRSHMHLNALLQNSSSGFLFEDNNRAILYANRMFCNMFGISGPDAITGFNCENVYRSIKDQLKEPEKFVRRISSLISRQKAVYNEELFLADGRVFSRDLIPVKEEEALMGYLWEFRDITRIKQFEEKLKEIKEAAELANSAKSRFLANMSHEIRSPLHGITGFVNLLESTPLSKKQKEFINYIKASSESLLAIINDILDLTKIESGKVELQNVYFNVKEVFEGLVMPYKIRAEEKGLKLSMTIKQEVPGDIEGDLIKIKQVIINLLSNAIKFTHQGEICVEVEVSERMQDTAEILVRVKDTGIGIPEDMLETIFDPFTQADISTTREYGGTGLGLSICRSIVEMMNGRIWVSSKEGEGSTFSFTAMCKMCRRRRSRTRRKQDGGKGCGAEYADVRDMGARKLEILLAEDNSVNRELFVNILLMNGFRCDIAKNGQEAVKACLDKDYDIVFMDCQMPLMDGYSATAEIRRHENGKRHTAIIALTANAMKNDLDKCMQAGMDDYISKPANIKDIMRVLSKWRVHKKTDYFNDVVRELMKETGINNITSIDIMIKFYDQADRLVKKMRRDIAAGSMEETAGLFHQLKGLAGNVRVPKIALLAEEAEEAVRRKDAGSLDKILSDIEDDLILLKGSSRFAIENSFLYKKRHLLDNFYLEG